MISNVLTKDEAKRWKEENHDDRDKGDKAGRF
jgi:hypothetical protein